mgnify:CR=1 FL=1
MKVGITALVIPADWGLDETLSTIKRDGYEALELALRDSGYFTLETPEAELAAIGRKASDAGIQITSVCPAMTQRPNLMSSDAAVRRDFERQNAASLATDVDGNPVFLATSKYNLQVTIEHWPKVGFHATREHGRTIAQGR